MSLSRAALLAALTTLLAAAPAGAAGDPIMPLSQVKRGMRCTGYTVIRGTDISSFDAEVLDVVSDATQNSSILARISGPAVDASGAGPGFSGSPVYCPAPDTGTPEVAGAIAQGIGDYGNKTLLLTPIEKMLGEPVRPPKSSRYAPRLLRGARSFAAPLSIAGLSPAISGVFVKAARRAGRVLFDAPAAPRVDFPVQTLRPGAAMAVGYSSGDLEAGAIGTVTYVDGTSMWAFGHPLDSAGARSLFLQDAYVYDVISAPYGSSELGTYKFAAPGHDLGALTGDNVFSVTGVLGEAPPSFPMGVTTTDLDRGTRTSLNLRVADERAVGNPTGLSPLSLVGPAAVAQSAYESLGSSPLHTSGQMCARFTIAQRSKPLSFCNTYVAVGAGSAVDGSSLVSAPEVGDFAQAAGLFDAYRLGPLTLQRIDVTMSLRRELAQAFLLAVKGPKRIVRGRDYDYRLTIARPGGARSEVTVKVLAPKGMTTGPRELVLTGTPSDPAGGGALASTLAALLGAAGDETGPTSIGDLARQVAAIHRYDGITASFRARRAQGQILDPPADPTTLPKGADGRALRERKVYRDPKLRISGARGIKVDVR